MEIRDYREGDEFEILKLFKAAFGRELSLEYWRWRFEMNPAGKHFIKLMWEGDRLIGHYAVSPVMMVQKDIKRKTALSMTTMTHPDYGGKGIFGMLANALYEDIHRNHAINLVWGFPNINSHYAFVKKLRWSDIGVLHELSISREQVDKSGLQIGDNISFLAHTSEIDERLLSKSEDHNTFSVVKDKNYLKWRIDDNPTQSYKIVAVNSGAAGQEVVMIFKKYGSGSNTIINIIDILGELTLENLSSLLSFAFEQYRDAARATIWMSLWKKEYAMLEKLRFIPSGNVTYLGCRAEDTQMGDLDNLKNWNLSFMDSDVY